MTVVLNELMKFKYFFYKLILGIENNRVNIKWNRDFSHLWKTVDSTYERACTDWEEALLKRKHLVSNHNIYNQNINICMYSSPPFIFQTYDSNLFLRFKLDKI